MDELVLRGMAKWPNVPSVFGWLRLDRRGQWLIKDERIANPAITAFIGRNYACDGEGRWFFQNGPQRVFVALDYTPFVYRISGGDDAPIRIETHQGSVVADLRGAWLDEHGVMLFATEHGIGSVHDADLDCLLPHLVDAAGNALAEDTIEERLEATREGQSALLWLDTGAARIRIDPIRSADVAKRFGFVPRPQQPAGEASCV